MNNSKQMFQKCRNCGKRSIEVDKSGYCSSCADAIMEQNAENTEYSYE